MTPSLKKNSLGWTDQGQTVISVFGQDHPFEDCEVLVNNARIYRDAKEKAWRFLKQVAIEMNQKDFDEVLAERSRRGMINEQ